MDEGIRRLVRRRADNRCEYCLLHQDHEPFYRFHIEHIIPRQHGGGDLPENLALACYHCNLHKGPNLAGIDPESREMVPVFNPRRDRWAEHFTLTEVTIVGSTPTGRATVGVLALNAPARLELRRTVQASSTE